MQEYKVIGHGCIRKESEYKVTGAAKYTSDYIETGMLHARMVTSTYAHALIKSIDVSEAKRIPGLRAVITGGYYKKTTGTYLKDRYPIAFDRVRYYGEPVAVVVAETELDAKRAAELIKVEYEQLEVVNSPSEALNKNAPIIHERLGSYKKIEEVFPVPGTNIASHYKIRKGNMRKGWAVSEVVAEEKFAFNESDHIAMETRNVIAEILPDGKIVITSSSQAPFDIKKQISEFFDVDEGNVVVNIPLVGGAYGGKTPVTLEFIACLASMAAGGRKVKLMNSREEDMITTPCHIGLEARIRIGSTVEGKIKAFEVLFMFDGGAYADSAVRIVKSAAVDCTGPYNIENVKCDSLCLYTDHPYATAFRGFGHSELTFVVERAMDILSEKLNMDPLKLRFINSIEPGDTSPTKALLTSSNIGNLKECIIRLSELMDWENIRKVVSGSGKIIQKAVSCFWKTSNTPTDAGAGAVITFNRDGSINIVCAAAEIGQGTRTGLALIAAEKFRMDPDMVHIEMKSDTVTSPEHWKTAASLTTIMVGKAVISACQDAIRQLKEIAAVPLRVNPEELNVGEGKVYIRSNPCVGIDIKDAAFGYEYPNGNTIGNYVIGRGSYILKGLTHIDPETGEGKTGVEWAVGAQGVEVEYDLKNYTYKILNAYTVIDAGKVINKIAARGQMTGGMAMGLSFASREAFLFNEKGIVLNPVLRTYKVLRYKENPLYFVDFVETPYLDGPYGARGLGEYGVIGMPAALANCLSKASGVQLNRLPLIPELIWETKRSMGNDIL